MARCTECGTPNDSDWRECNRCGTALDRSGTSETTDSRSTWRMLAAGGAFVTAIAAFLPWAVATSTLFSLSAAGIDGDGVFTLALAVAVGIGALAAWNPWGIRASLAGGTGTILIAALALNNVVWATDSVHAGVGLYATVLGGLAMAGGGLAGLEDRGSETERSGVSVERHSPVEFEDATLRTIAVLLEREQIATAERIQTEVYAEHTEGYRSRESWWADVQERLAADRRFNEIDGGDRWALARR